MGRDFQYYICINSCECNNRFDCECDYLCKERIDDGIFGKSIVCDCDEERANRYYLRNHPLINKYFHLYDTKEHYMYSEIKEVLDILMEGKTAYDVLYHSYDEIWCDDHEWELIQVLGYILKRMRDTKAKCVWLLNC